MQDVAGVAFQLGAAALEHGAVLFIHDLDAQAFGGEIEQDLALELLQLLVALDRSLDVLFQLAQLLDFFLRFQAQKLLPRRFQVDDLLLRRQLALFHLPFAARQILAAALDDAGTVAAAAAAHQRHLERRLEIFGDALQIALGGRTQQPHEKKKCHHRRDEVGVGDLPCATVMSARHLLDALDNDGALVLVFSHDRALSVSV